MIKIKTITIIMLLIFVNLQADTIFDNFLKLPKEKDQFKSKVNRRNYFVIPLAGYSEDTGFSGGGMFYAFYKKSKINKRIFTSKLRAFVLYTTKNQKRFSFSIDDYLTPLKSKVYLDLTYRDWHKDYYGKGGETNKDDGNRYECKYLNFTSEFKRNFFSIFYFGLKGVISIDRDIEFNNGHNFKYSIGFGDYNFSGFGPVFEIDTRDNNIFPHSGLYLKSETLFYEKFFKNSYSFRTQKISFTNYLNLKKLTKINYSVLAGRLVYELSDGDVPFRLLPGFGGNKNMRGLSSGRYKDKQAIYLECEYRTRIYERLGLTFFTGIGNVGSDFSNFFDTDFKTIIGFGFRYQLNSTGVNIRFDFGYSFDDKELAKVISGNEAY